MKDTSVTSKGREKNGGKGAKTARREIMQGEVEKGKKMKGKKKEGERMEGEKIGKVEKLRKGAKTVERNNTWKG